MAKTNVSYEDVINFFEDADLDLANLTHQLVTGKLNARIEKRQAVGERMSKARKSRKPKGQDGQVNVETVTEVPATPVQSTQATERHSRHNQTVSA